MADSKKKQKEEFKPDFGTPLEVRNYSDKRKQRIKEIEDSARQYGRQLGQERQRGTDYLGGPIGSPAAYVKRAGQYVSDKATDLDAYLSEKLGMEERAATRRGERMGLKEEGYKKGGSVSSASKRADGCAMRGKTKGRML
jgi:hypothetical protein